VRIWSAGYQRSASPRSFAAHLARQGIDLALDIRRAPRSQRPGYDAAGLSEALEYRGVEYHSVVRLGNLDALLPLWRDDPAQARMVLSAYFLAQEPRLLDRVLTVATQRRVCLICVCPDWQHCHRRALLSALEQRHGTLEHIDISPD